LNLRPSGYEPDELPGCSTPRRGCARAAWCGARGCEWVLVCTIAPATKPGGVLLFHRLGDSTIGAVWFHGRVRDGIGWVTDAMATKLCGRRNVCWLGEIDAMTMLSVTERKGCVWFETRKGFARPTGRPDPSEARGGEPRLRMQPPAFEDQTNSVDVDGGAHQARIEQLGPVSSMRYRTSTSGLSRSWSSTAL
jgi:hypothetical protein